MSDPATVTSSPPFMSRKGVDISWDNIFKLLGWAAPLLLGLIVTYLHTTYATHEEVDTKTVAIAAPLKVDIGVIQETERSYQRNLGFQHEMKTELDRHNALLEKLTADRASDHDLLLRVDEHVKDLIELEKIHKS